MKFDKVYKLLLQESDESDTATEFEDVAAVDTDEDLSPQDKKLMKLLGLADTNELLIVKTNRPRALSTIIDLLKSGKMSQEAARDIALIGGEEAPRPVESELDSDEIPGLDDEAEEAGSEGEVDPDSTIGRSYAKAMKDQEEEDRWFRGGNEEG